MGKVFLVGAGPGDPGLLTRRAARLLRRADVVVHDALINERLLELAPPSAERIDVGKRCGGRHTSQSEIHRILVEAAGRSAVVVRLKGGDPFIFGRGAEEALALTEAGVPFEVVPGITAAAAAAYAGIPLTHRGLASAVTLLTGHEGASGVGSAASSDGDTGTSRPFLPADPGGTLVVYMGMRRLPELVAWLLDAGRAPDSPAAVIEWGTYARQRTVTAPLAELPERVRRSGVGSPAVVVVGDVVDLREQMSWFEARPLFGVRILVPRSRPQASRLAARLGSLGADVLEFPRMVSLPARDPAPLRLALRSLRRRYDWVLFVSTKAVSAFWEEWRASGRDGRKLAGIRFACCGTATGTALERLGIRPDIALPTFDPATLLAELRAHGAADGAAVLFPGETDTPSALADRLSEHGFLVRRVEAYRSQPDAAGADEVRRQLDEGTIHAVAFSSSGTVRSFAAALGADAGHSLVAAIGPETVRTALSLGLPVHVVPGDSSLQGLVDGLAARARGQVAQAEDAGEDRGEVPVAADAAGAGVRAGGARP